MNLNALKIKNLVFKVPEGMNIKNIVGFPPVDNVTNIL
jgi:hypothetical protein